MEGENDIDSTCPQELKIQFYFSGSKLNECMGVNLDNSVPEKNAQEIL